MNKVGKNQRFELSDDKNFFTEQELVNSRKRNKAFDCMLTNYETKKKEIDNLQHKFCKVEKSGNPRSSKVMGEMKFMVDEIFKFEPTMCYMSTLLGVMNHNCRDKKSFPAIKPEVISIVPFTQLKNRYSDINYSGM